MWSAIASSMVAEAISTAGFDWIVLDMEHGPNELPDLVTQLQAMKGGTASPVVRVPWNDFVVIKRVLDIGAQSLLVPYVQNADEARQAVAAIRYPMAGIRGVAGTSRATGYGAIKDYATKAAGELCLLLQVETAEAMGRLEDIASVDGVDGVFIGPADLSASMGHLGNINAPEVQDAIRGAASRLKAIGKPSGILALGEADIRRSMDWGFDFIAVGVDMGIIARGAEALAAKYKGA